MRCNCIIETRFFIPSYSNASLLGLPCRAGERRSGVCPSAKPSLRSKFDLRHKDRAASQPATAAVGENELFSPQNICHTGRSRCVLFAHQCVPDLGSWGWEMPAFSWLVYERVPPGTERINVCLSEQRPGEDGRRRIEGPRTWARIAKSRAPTWGEMTRHKR